LSLKIQLNKRRLGCHQPVGIGDPINKKEVRIPLTGCHWRSNYQNGGSNPINRLALEIHLNR
jgi:hypothetical protein